MPKKKATKKAAKRKSARKAPKANACCEDWGNNLGKKIEKKCKTPGSQHCGGCAYFLGFLGSAIYYIMNASGFWNGVWGVIKALVWPAFLVFELFKFLGM